MKRYNPSEIEPKWQKAWAESRLYEARDDPAKPKRYILEYFPYPSGAAMHVGHVRNYTIGDTLARHMRMSGYNVLHPMGWDAFGLPAENYAIKTGISPQQAIKENTGKFKQQLMQMGFGYDWSREFASSDPEYYRWTQWLFLLLYKRGLAYRKESPQWWCPVDKTVLANEQVENGRCWRCGTEVEKKALPQWFFKITDYADRLEKDLNEVNWTESIKNMQRNWIGRSVGAEIDFKVEDSDEIIKVFTTRADTLFGTTFLVVAPEHPLLKKIVPARHAPQVEHYQAKVRGNSDVQRQETDREKTGTFTGAYAVNPINSERIPIWTADYVLMGYGTGAIIAVPAHDERDYEFAKKFDLPIRDVIENIGNEADALVKEGTIINSGDYNGLDSSEARERITSDLAEEGVERVNYKIRDWLISRQRYWGAPIPIIHCRQCGIQPVPESQLPVTLPNMESYEPSGDGHSPLARIEEFVSTTCPNCGGPAQRETDTMDGFACSSWYFLRFADPHNNEKAFAAEKVKHWLPVDDYIGGAEHAVMHLLYARMWTKVMFDEGLIDFHEPFKTLRNHGMILAPDGRKMSKSWGNVIAPDDLIKQGYGADAIRIMELFIGPWNQSANWSVEGVGGAFRFLQRVWTLAQEYLARDDIKGKANDILLKRATHRTVKKVTEDLEGLGFNTAIAAMMELVNGLYKLKREIPYESASETWQETLETLLQLLAPFAPHITEELWQQFGHESSIHIAQWPKYDEKYIISDTITIAIQVNGKLRGQIEVTKDVSEDGVKAAAWANPNVKQYIENKDLKRVIYVPGRLMNIVI
ncbi:leucyl-tRNA synthetase [candidate division TM7 genomosp. GTL1]|nr:leucyl-tRNA synthetase [candidate division TM7 genomosp. GTL1]